jgi:hypothetical protein
VVTATEILALADSIDDTAKQLERSAAEIHAEAAALRARAVRQERPTLTPVPAVMS